MTGSVRRWLAVGAAVAAALLLPGCDNAKPDAGAAILDELRHLRQDLASQPAAARSAPVDSQLLTAVLDPVRDGMRTLHQENAALQERQRALSDELTRWTMFLAMTQRGDRPVAVPMQVWPGSTPGTTQGGATPGGAAPGAAAPRPVGGEPGDATSDLLQKIAALQRELDSQREHQRDVDGAVQRALESTAVRVEGFLEQLQQLRRDGRLGPTAGVPGAPDDAAHADRPVATEPDRSPAQPLRAGAEGTAADERVGDGRNGHDRNDASLLLPPSNSVDPAPADRPVDAPAHDDPVPESAVRPHDETPPASATTSPEAARLAAEQRTAALVESGVRGRSPWLWGALLACMLAVVALGWRLLRPAAAPPRAGMAVRDRSGESSAEELWAAASLLSEAVGRLKSTVPAAAPTRAAGPADEPAVPVDDAPAPAPAAGLANAAEATVDAPRADVEPDAAATAVDDEVPAWPPKIEEPPEVMGFDPHDEPVGDDVFVLDDGALSGVDWSTVLPPLPPPPARAPAHPVQNGRDTGAAAPMANGQNGHHETAEPPRVSLSLDVKDHVLARATVDAYLRADPRVLQRPAPVVRARTDGIEVELSLLPGLLPGEREHLRATLQKLMTHI